MGFAGAILGCGVASSQRVTPGPSGSASATNSAPAPLPAAPASPLPASPTERLDGNPLHLGPSTVTLDPGKRVFTFSDKMLRDARIGSTLVLYAATVTGFDGEDLIIEGRGGPSYKVHPGYAIPVPDEPRLKPSDPVLTEWNGVMKHAIVVRFIKDRIAVRYTDTDVQRGEVLLPSGSGKPTAAGPSKAARFVRQAEGLVAGNYAALNQGTDISHVLLVSSSGRATERTWFCLGFGGAAVLARDSDLTPIPVTYSPKVGTKVLGEWTGKMRPAVVHAADEPGLFLIKFERAGRPIPIGWGLLMPRGDTH